MDMSTWSARRLLRVSAGLLAIGAMLAGCGVAPQAQAQAPEFDVLIRGGQLLDGTGAAAVAADVGIKGDRIAAIGQLANRPAKTTIDATGLIVAPGFIDLHTHSEMPLLADGTAQSKVRQGVTLDVMGESTSVAPRDGLAESAGGDGPRPDWTTFTGYFDRLEKQGSSINVIAHVASEQVRRVVKGYDASPATPQELARMRDLVARSMQEGAWGLVTRFESGGPAHPREILEMARVVASYGGNYTSHAGSEGFEQTKELAFAIRVAEEAKIPVHIFHFKIRARENWGSISRFITQTRRGARKRGLNITANQYPVHRDVPWLERVLPGMDARRRPGQVRRAAAATGRFGLASRRIPDFIAWAKEHGWWEGIVMARARTEKNRQYQGKRIAEIAKLRGDADPMDTCIDLMAEEGGSISGIFHTMSEDDVRTVMRLPWVAIASDGSAINLEAPGVPHPRNYSSNVRVLGHYVRDQKVLMLAEAVRKMTALPAEILGLKDRGQIKAGFAADVAIFDPARVAETNSFEQPKSYAAGVPFVIVNGVVVLDRGQHTGAKPGRALRGPGFKKAGTTSPAQ